MPVISNTTVISNFASIQQIELLHVLYGDLYISTQVYEEILDGLAEGYRVYTTVQASVSPLFPNGWLRLTSLNDDSEFRAFAAMPNKLHSGESSCLAIAEVRKWLFLSDDMAARKEAQRRRIAVSGTLGCLVLAIEHDICTLEDANLWLHKMMEMGYRCPVSDLSSFLLHK